MSQPNSNDYVPVSALCAESRINDIYSKIVNTLDRGALLCIIKAVGTKTMESEIRIAWLASMTDGKLVVRKLESIGRNNSDKFRAESSRDDELG